MTQVASCSWSREGTLIESQCLLGAVPTATAAAATACSIGDPGARAAGSQRGHGDVETVTRARSCHHSMAQSRATQVFSISEGLGKRVGSGSGWNLRPWGGSSVLGCGLGNGGGSGCSFEGLVGLGRARASGGATDFLGLLRTQGKDNNLEGESGISGLLGPSLLTHPTPRLGLWKEWSMSLGAT